MQDDQHASHRATHHIGGQASHWLHGSGGHTHIWWRSTQQCKFLNVTAHQIGPHIKGPSIIIEPWIILGQTLHWLPMLVRIHTPMLEYKKVTMHPTGSHITFGIHHMSDVI